MEMFLTFFVFLCVTTLSRCEIQEAIACSGDPSLECGHFELVCGSSEKIRLLNQEYAYKDHECNMNKRRSRCLEASRNGCCVYDPVDCAGAYSQLHLYNLMRECSGNNRCGPLPAPTNILSNCGSNTSTYVRIQYDCFKEDSFLNFCDSSGQTESGEKNLIFSQTTNTLTEPSKCTCETSIFDGDQIEISYIDVRMMRAPSDTGRTCSSAVLKEEPDNSGSQINCNETLPEEYNLKANILGITNVNNGQLKFTLDNLFINGKDDSPVMIWIHIRAISGTLKTKCYREPLRSPTVSTQPLTTTSTSAPPVTGSQNNTGEVTKPVSGDDNTGVVIGVLIPVILAVIAAMVLFILWRRRQSPLKKRRHVAQNSYTSSVGSQSSAAINNTVYDEIGDLPNATQPPPYDPEYQLATETPHGYENTIPNSTAMTDGAKNKTHTYQNLKGKNLPESGKNSRTNKVSSKLQFGDFINKKSRLLSFFRRKNNDSLAPPNIAKKPSDASVTSYDHLNASSLEVRLEVTAPDDERNQYAHTIPDESYEHANGEVHTSKPNIQHTASPEPKKSPNVIKRSASPKGVKAVSVGDSYIEFQFGTLDEDGPDLFNARPKTLENSETNTKLSKPSRPPPKPSSKTDSSEGVNMKSLNPTERPVTETTQQQAYDYADTEEKSSMADGSPKPDKFHDKTDSRNSDLMYSYADLEDDNQEDNLSPELLYEDVEENPEIGLKKCSSAQDISGDSSGGYEVPVKGSRRPLSDSNVVNPGSKSETKSAIKGIENIITEVTSPVGLGHIVKELKEIQDLPDLSDPEKLPKELKYANLGLHKPVKRKAEKNANTVDQNSQNEVANNKAVNGNKNKGEYENQVEEPAIRKGVLSLARKFEAPNK